jgi:membrane protein YqaA with SNARE-associated domain
MRVARPRDPLPSRHGYAMDATFETLGLWGLLASSFLSATLLPGNSELALVALLHHAPGLKWPALAVATFGNTLGGLTSYMIGRLFPGPREGRAVTWMHRYGTPSLLLAWVPVIGDALCVVAGWLRQNVIAAALFMAIGKFARYWLLATGVGLWGA